MLGPCSSELSEDGRAGGQGHPPAAVVIASTPSGRGVPSQSGAWEGDTQNWGIQAAHLVVSHQMLYRLAICCGDLLDVGGFLLPGPSQLWPQLSMSPHPCLGPTSRAPQPRLSHLIGHCLLLGHDDVFLTQRLLQLLWAQDSMTGLECGWAERRRMLTLGLQGQWLESLVHPGAPRAAHCAVWPVSRHHCSG